MKYEYLCAYDYAKGSTHGSGRSVMLFNYKINSVETLICAEKDVLLENIKNGDEFDKLMITNFILLRKFRK